MFLFINLNSFPPVTKGKDRERKNGWLTDVLVTFFGYFHSQKTGAATDTHGLLG